MSAPVIRLYSRVSTRAQADDGQSLEAQARALRAYVELHRLAYTADVGTIVYTNGKIPPTQIHKPRPPPLVDYIDRAVSGAKALGERPEGARLLADLQPDDVVIATKLDRMFRSALDALGMLERFREQGIALHLIDLGGDVCGNGIARLVFTILSAVAEAERERIGERIRDVVADRRARGMWLGGARAPFGWAVGEYGELVEEPREQDSLREAKALREQGLSLRRISAVMEERGTPLSWQGVGRALKREVHASELGGEQP